MANLEPNAPERHRQALVTDLMRARNAIAAARRDADRDAERTARETVDHVKIALGERAPYGGPTERLI